MTPPKPDKEIAAKENGADSVSASNSEVSATDETSQLTPEEQMALYEKDLKENDWGHQPC